MLSAIRALYADMNGENMMDKNKIVVLDNDTFNGNKNLKYPGDKIIQEKMPNGDIVTRLNTKKKKATHRQYIKKDGTPGKQTMIIMQSDEEE